MIASASRHIPVGVRRAVIERDGLVCRRCGVSVHLNGRGSDALHLDHVEHWAAGGDHTVDNLIVCCASCNLRRSKPKRAVRVGRRGVIAERHNNAWYWMPGYNPPEAPDLSTAHSFQWVLDYLNLSPAQLVRLIEGGTFGATSGIGPIRVRMPDVIEDHLRQSEEERRQLARARSNAAWREGAQRANRVRAEAPRKPPALDPAEVDYWRGLIEARRARERAAKEARRAAREND